MVGEGELLEPEPRVSQESGPVPAREAASEMELRGRGWPE